MIKTPQLGKIKPKGWPKESKRHSDAAKRGHARKRRSMFGPPRYRKYSSMVDLTSYGDAQESSKKLTKEFNLARTRAKRRRIKRVTVLAANRADVMAGNKRLKSTTRQEKARVARVYRETADRMELD